MGVIAPLTWVLISGCLSRSEGKPQSGQLLEIKFRSDEILISLAAGVQIPVSFESGAGFGPADSNEHPNLHSYTVEGKQRSVLGMGHPPHKLYELSAFIITPQIPAGRQLVTPHPAFKHPLPFQMPGGRGADLSKESWGLGSGMSQRIPPPQGVAEQGRDPAEGLGAEGSRGSQPSCCSQTGIPFPGFVWCAKGLDQFCSESRGCSTPPQPTPPPAFLRGR